MIVKWEGGSVQNELTDSQTHRQTDRERERETTDRQTERETDRQRERERERERHTHTHTHTHTQTDTQTNTYRQRERDTHTHTHTQSGICGLRGLSIGVMVFILYKLYVLQPYTYPTPKLIPHRRLCAFLDSMFFKPFGLRGHRQCPHKPPLCCNTHIIIQI